MRHAEEMIDIRATEPDEWRAAADAFRAALMWGPITDDDFDKSRGSWEGCDSLTAWEGERCVAHVGAFRFATVVPGGAWLPTAGVTRVGVLPTHTRRGLLTEMLHRLLVEAADRGQALASLRASEAVIYRRFGFGVAGEAAELELDPQRARVARGAAPGTMRLLRPDEVLATVGACYPRVAPLHVGAIDRPAWLVARYLEDPAAGTGNRFVAVHESVDGEIDGYVDYETSFVSEFGAMPHGTAQVHDLWGATPAVEVALWRYVLSIDLVRRVRAEERPIDDPIRWAVHDYRGVRLGQRWDEQWLRLLDAEAALAARTYGPGPSVTVAVTDPLLPGNTGTWRISAEGAQHVSDQADASADLAVDITTLSAVYLGGTSWSELAAVGDVVVRDQAALAAADALFSSRPAPFCGSFF
jgi:predicted acetyltransferase